MPKAIPTPMVNHRPRKFLEFFSGRPDLGHNLSSTGTKGDFMKAPDLVELAARNLRESVLRNSLTTVGIGVGVASLVAMLSLGIGLQQLANRRLERSGLFDTIMVTSRRGFRGFERRASGDGPSPAESRALDENARLEISRLPDVLEVWPDIRFVTELHYQGKPHLTMVAGLPPSARENDAFENIQGQFFSSQHRRRSDFANPVHR